MLTFPGTANLPIGAFAMTTYLKPAIQENGVPREIIVNRYPHPWYFSYVWSLKDLGGTPRVCIEPKELSVILI